MGLPQKPCETSGIKIDIDSLFKQVKQFKHGICSCDSTDCVFEAHSKQHGFIDGT
jgi:hypothetical protein